MPEEDEQEVYRRSWDAFIDAYGALLEKNQVMAKWCEAAYERLQKAPKTSINQTLIQEYEANGESWRGSTDRDENRVSA